MNPIETTPVTAAETEPETENERAMTALLDELPEPTPEELDAAAAEFVECHHLSAPTNWQELEVPDE